MNRLEMLTRAATLRANARAVSMQDRASDYGRWMAEADELERRASLEVDPAPRAPRKGEQCPWGTIQYADPMPDLPGVVSVGTAGHGGLWIPLERRGELPKGWRHRAWLEEDCEAVIGLWWLGYTHDGDPEWSARARRTLAAYFPGLDPDEVDRD